MEMDQTQPKFARSSSHGNGNGRFVTATTIGHQSGKMDDEEDELGDHRLLQNGVDLGGGGGLARSYGRYPSSRIVRVSRASGGKDRHSKVLTSKGLRDRRVRLSVNTAIQFYDLQDRLGFDQPSKAVEWLLKAAGSAIAELPPMNYPFPDTPKQLSDEKWSSTNEQLGLDSAHEVDMGSGGGGGGDVSHIQQQLKRSSASSSPSDTSRGSGLTLSRSESGVKTSREQAKKRLAEKDKESSSSIVACLNPMSQTTSFTELLSGGGGGGGINSSNNHDNNNTTTNTATNETNFFLKSPRQQQWSSSTPLDYFTSGLIGSPVPSPMFNATMGDHPSSDHFPHFSFTSSDHLFPVVNATASGQYNLNFAISSSSVGANSTSPSTSLAGLINRGTLQSNSSSSQLPHLQRFPTTVVDGSSTHQSFFDNGHHQFLPAGFDARLQLCYGDNNGRRAGHKGKGKN